VGAKYLFDNISTLPLAAGTPLYRIFRTGRSRWWFSYDGTGRFDLPFPAGTCYLAEDPLAALLQVRRGLTLLSEAFLDARQLLAARFRARVARS